ncbi:DUF262 domain-containing protein [Massilia sp. H-1]|nr:DUF262 domain-containing protein [Massilia sp. H-1]
MEDKKVERYKLWPTQVDRGQLKAIVDEGSSESLATREKAEFSQKKTGVNPNMIGAYQFFYGKINELLNDPSVDLPIEEKVEALFSSLKNDLALVSIELEGGDDPQVIFETLNGFGQPLLPTDLMRNYIFQTAYRGGPRLPRPSRSSKRRREDSRGAVWTILAPPRPNLLEKEEKQGRIKRPRVDNFFMHFLAMKKATDSRGLMDAETWDEESIAKRSRTLLAAALTVWRHPKHAVPAAPSTSTTTVDAVA